MDDGPKLWDILRVRVPIEKVAKRYSRGKRIQKSGTGWVCRCVCGNKTDTNPSVKVWRDGHAHCYSCGRHFKDVIALYQCGAKLAKRWEACQQMRDDYLGPCYDTTVMTTDLRASAETMNRAPASGEMPDWVRTLLAITLAHYQSSLSKSSEALAYLREVRGLTDDTIRRMRIGYADESGLKLALYRSRTLSDWGGKTVLSRASDLGLITEHGEFMRQRIIFPVLDDEGQALFLVGRSTQTWQADTKYLNMPNSDYVVRRPMVWGNSVKGAIVVEGPMDAAALLQWGMDKDHLIVTLLGVGFEAVLHLLENTCKGKQVVLALDQDNAGKAAALKHVVVLQEQGLTCRVLVDRDRYDAARRCVKEKGGVGRNALADEQVIELEKASQHVLLVRNLRTLGVVTGVNWCGAKDHAEMLTWTDGRCRFEEGLL